jgi:hypothetical protein
MPRINIKDYADSNCNKCIGRGFTGIIVKSGLPIVCKCVKKNYIRREREKKLKKISKGLDKAVKNESRKQA